MTKSFSLNLQSGWRKYGQGLAALLALVVFLPALAAWFTGEDFTFILPASTGKPFYQTWQNLFYRPLPNLLWQLDFTAWGLNAPGFHLTNLVLHAANVWLVGHIVRKTVHSDYAVVAAAGLFALTPVHIEPVVWLAGRPDLLATFFSLLTLVAMQQFSNSNQWSYYVAALAAFGAAIFSKESAAGLPFILMGFGLLTTGWPHAAQDWRKFIFNYLPFFIVEAVYWLVRYAVLGSMGSYGNDGLMNVAWNLTIGLWQPLLFPFNFESAGWVIGGLLSAILLAFYGWLLLAFMSHFSIRNQLKHLAFPLILMYGGMAPALTLAPVGLNLSQSRLLYLPSAGFCWLLAWLIRLKLLEIKKTTNDSFEPGEPEPTLSIPKGGRIRFQKLLLGLVPGLIYFAGLLLGLSPWLQAGNEAKATFDQLQQARLPFQPGDYIYYEGLPDNYQGAYIWRNGLGEASSLLLGKNITGTRRLPDQLVDYSKAVQGRLWFVHYQPPSANNVPAYLFGYSLAGPGNSLDRPGADTQNWNLKDCQAGEWKLMPTQGDIVCQPGQGLYLGTGWQKTSLSLSGPDLKPPANVTGLEVIFSNYVDFDFQQPQIFSDLTLNSPGQTLSFQQPFELAADGKPHQYHFFLPLPPGHSGDVHLTFDFTKFRSNILWENIQVRFTHTQ